MEENKKTIITGVTGQDGSYLAKYLLTLGYEVWGLVRKNSQDSYLANLNYHGIANDVKLCRGDLTDVTGLQKLIHHVQPDEFYNLGAQSFVPLSWDIPIHVSDVNALGVLNALEAIKLIKPDTKFYQASSSEMFGKVIETPQKETTPFYPRSPYAVAKVFGHFMTINYRESYNMFAVSGILFNHESSIRGTSFVTRKITDGVAKIKIGIQDKLSLGNLEAKRDWGYAGDSVKAIHMMLQQQDPIDYVIGTGVAHSVREFCDMAFSYVGLNYEDYVVEDPQFFRPVDVDILLADPSLANEQLGWRPEVSFEDLVKMMVDHDMEKWKSYGSYLDVRNG